MYKYLLVFTVTFICTLSLAGCDRRKAVFDMSPTADEIMYEEMLEKLPDAQTVPVYGRVTAYDRSISIIFEGYSHEIEMMMLADLIEERKVETVFFIPGAEAMSDPAVVKYIFAKGIPVGNYGLTGEKRMELNKTLKNLRQVYLTQQAIENAVVVAPKYLRLNQTEYTEEFIKIAGLCGLKAAVQPNVFLNHRSFANREQVYNYIRSTPRGSVISIKLGQELDAQEVKTVPLVNARPVEGTPSIANMEPVIKNDVNIVDMVGWVLDACEIENHVVVSIERLHDIAEEGVPEKEVPAELLEKLDAAKYPNLVNEEAFGVKEGPAADGAYFDKAVFIGDSIAVGIENFVIRSRRGDPGFFGDAKFLAAGGMSVRNALWQVSDESRHPTYNGEKMLLEDAIALMDVDKVYIMLGMNDILLTPDVETYLGNYQILINLIRAQSPGVEIFIQSITPGTAVEVLEPNNAQIFEYDLALVEFCYKYGYHYIDVATALRDENGALREEYCSDPDRKGFHFTNEACGIWLDYLRTHTDTSGN